MSGAGHVVSDCVIIGNGQKGWLVVQVAIPICLFLYSFAPIVLPFEL